MNLKTGKLNLYSSSPERTAEIAGITAAFARPGDVYALEGTLGAGKTLFAQGFATGLGIVEPVTSPTFPIIQEYDHEPPFYHMDLYRLHSADDVIDTGAEELIYGSGVSLIEWPDRAEELLPAESIRIHIDITAESARSIAIEGPALRIEEMKSELTKGSE